MWKKFIPKTAFVKELMVIRSKAVKKGLRLLSVEEVEQVLCARRRVFN